GMTSGRGARAPSASRRANASTSEAKSVPALPRNTSMPRSASSSRYASAVVAGFSVREPMPKPPGRGDGSDQRPHGGEYYGGEDRHDVHVALDWSTASPP